MNLPLVAETAPIGKYPSWDQWLNEGLVKVRAATFVSAMFKRDAIARCGFPNRKFFIWGDDIEFTERIVRAGFVGLLVGNSFAVHKRAQLEALSIVTEKNSQRIRMMQNWYRNNTWSRMRSKSTTAAVRTILSVVRDIVNIFLKSDNHKILRAKSVLFGYISGITKDLSNDATWEMTEGVEKLSRKV